MPELSEVEITRRSLLPLLRGRRIIGFWTDWPRGLKTGPRDQGVGASMRNRRILDVTRRGKVLFFKLSRKAESTSASIRVQSGAVRDQQKMMAIHLRMSGHLAIFSPGRPRDRWTHFSWQLDRGQELRFVDPRKFGVVWYGDAEALAQDPYLGRLGRDPQGIGVEEFARIVRRSRGMVKPFLLRQDRFAGIGNIIADEALWRARMHPETRITSLDARARRRLCFAIQHTIRAMLSSGGASLRNWASPDGHRGRYQERRRVYGRAGEPCPRCRKKLIRIVVGGRGTTVCRACQRL